MKSRLEEERVAAAERERLSQGREKLLTLNIDKILESVRDLTHGSVPPMAEDAKALAILLKESMECEIRGGEEGFQARILKDLEMKMAMQEKNLHPNPNPNTNPTLNDNSNTNLTLGKEATECVGDAQ